MILLGRTWSYDEILHWKYRWEFSIGIIIFEEFGYLNLKVNPILHSSRKNYNYTNIDLFSTFFDVFLHRKISFFFFVHLQTIYHRNKKLLNCMRYITYICISEKIKSALFRRFSWLESGKRYDLIWSFVCVNHFTQRLLILISNPFDKSDRNRIFVTLPRISGYLIGSDLLNQF